LPNAVGDTAFFVNNSILLVSTLQSRFTSATNYKAKAEKFVMRISLRLTQTGAIYE
jgi:hypothetical protein